LPRERRQGPLDDVGVVVAGDDDRSGSQAGCGVDGSSPIFARRSESGAARSQN
jgi:hypothetical protein